MTTTKTNAFALAGLAGNNAHGAGFLQAALDEGVRPAMMSCTSGQIYYVYLYLQALNGNSQAIVEVIDAATNRSTYNLDLFVLNVFGRPGVFRPAREEFLLDVYRNTLTSWARTVTDWDEVNFFRELFSLIPARTLVPEFSDEFYREIATAFNQAEMGLAFNSYNPTVGVEYVYLNQEAAALLGVKLSEADEPEREPVGCEQGQGTGYRVQTLYKAITPAAVRAGLWIYQYGFEEDSPDSFDGAYYRPVILSELTPADRIFVLRPQNYRWLGPLPGNYVGLEDLQTETQFNSAYVGERDKIYLINRLLQQGKLSEAAAHQYHCIDLIEIEVETQESYFEYVFESRTVFDSARVRGRKLLQELVTG